MSSEPSSIDSGHRGPPGRGGVVTAAKRWPALLLGACLAAGCSSEQIYSSAQGWRRSECEKIMDAASRERCRVEADRSYDAYRAGQSPSR